MLHDHQLHIESTQIWHQEKIWENQKLGIMGQWMLFCPLLIGQKRDEGALVSLRVIPLADIWKVSADMKVMCALFLLEKANQAGYDSDDDASVSVRGLVTSMLSNVARPLTASSSYRCNEM